MRRTRPALQRYGDLEEIYADNDELQQDPWFAKFKHIQRILRNPAVVHEHLTSLAKYMKRNREPMSESLRGFEAARNPGSLPQLTDFVPPDVFADLVGRGEIFEDLVNPAHGMQTHRLQWYVIASEMGDNWAKEAYTQSVDPRWRVTLDGYEKNMWDFIVDQLGAESVLDFTQPRNLETYLTEPMASLRGIGPLVSDIRAGHRQVRDAKEDLRTRYPPEDSYTSRMKVAVRQLALLDGQARSQPFAERAKTADEKRDVVRKIQFERITTTTEADGVQKQITWTGWIAREDSQEPRPEFPRLIPTVAYVVQ